MESKLTKSDIEKRLGFPIEEMSIKPNYEEGKFVGVDIDVVKTADVKTLTLDITIYKTGNCGSSGDFFKK